MKFAVLIFIYLFSFPYFGIAQVKQAGNDTQVTETAVTKTVDKSNEKTIENKGNNSDPVQAKCKKYAEINFLQWVIVFFMPVTMLFFAMYFIWRFRGSQELTVSRIIGLPKSSGRSGDDVLMSSSRFIALLTGLTAIFVVVTLMMYYGYILVAECEIELPLTQLWTIIAGLGIGVIPYGFNVWNKNGKESRIAEMNRESIDREKNMK